MSILHKDFMHNKSRQTNTCLYLNYAEYPVEVTNKTRSINTSIYMVEHLGYIC